MPLPRYLSREARAPKPLGRLCGLHGWRRRNGTVTFKGAALAGQTDYRCGHGHKGQKAHQRRSLTSPPACSTDPQAEICEAAHAHLHEGAETARQWSTRWVLLHLNAESEIDEWMNWCAKVVAAHIRPILTGGHDRQGAPQPLGSRDSRGIAAEICLSLWK